MVDTGFWWFRGAGSHFLLVLATDRSPEKVNFVHKKSPAMVVSLNNINHCPSCLQQGHYVQATPHLKKSNELVDFDSSWFCGIQDLATQWSLNVPCKCRSGSHGDAEMPQLMKALLGFSLGCARVLPICQSVWANINCHPPGF